MSIAENSIGIVSPQTARFDQVLELESQGQLASYDIVYETYGTLNSQASNAILVAHALSGDHHAAGHHDDTGKTEGWWNNLIGPNKPIDTNRFFVVCCNLSLIHI